MTGESDAEPGTAAPLGDPSRPSEAVLAAVASERNCDPAELPVLTEAVDPDALDALFRGRESGHVEFEYAGCRVVVRGARDVTATEIS